MSLRNLYENGFTINFYCTAYLKDLGRPCNHGGQVDMQSLIQRFGWDFEISERRAWFLRHFVCSKCGARETTLRIQNPPHKPDPTVWVW